MGSNSILRLSSYGSSDEMLRSICLLIVIASVYGIDNQLTLDDAALAQIINYIYNNDGFGNYKFGFSTTNGIERYEESVVENPNTKDESRVVKGSYSYPGADGKMIKVKYTADKNGFHPEGDNIFVPAYATSDSKEPEVKEETGNSINSQRFNREYVAEDANTYNANPHNFEDYHSQVSQLIQQQQGNQQYAHEEYGSFSPNENYNNELQENSQPDQFNYDRSLLEFLGPRSQQHVNYNQQPNRQKPIIAILGDDGKLVDSTNFENLNLPESILELLSRGNIPTNEVSTILEKPKLKEPEPLIGDFRPVKEEIPVKSEESMETNESSYVTSSTVDLTSTEATTVSSSTIESSKS